MTKFAAAALAAILTACTPAFAQEGAYKLQAGDAAPFEGVLLGVDDYQAALDVDASLRALQITYGQARAGLAQARISLQASGDALERAQADLVAAREELGEAQAERFPVWQRFAVVAAVAVLSVAPLWVAECATGCSRSTSATAAGGLMGGLLIGGALVW